MWLNRYLCQFFISPLIGTFIFFFKNNNNTRCTYNIKSYYYNIFYYLVRCSALCVHRIYYTVVWLRRINSFNQLRTRFNNANPPTYLPTYPQTYLSKCTLLLLLLLLYRIYLGRHHHRHRYASIHFTLLPTWPFTPIFCAFFSTTVRLHAAAAVFQISPLHRAPWLIISTPPPPPTSPRGV